MTKRITRKAYSYKRADGTTVRVPAKRIADKGLPGRGPKVLPKLKKGTLGAHGYRQVKSLTLKQRHAALRKAVKALGAHKVIAKLTAVRNYQKNTNPRLSAMFKKDAQWVHSTFLKV